jgi:hypothetical protein
MSLDRELSRRRFMRGVMGAGVGLLSLEFVGGSLAFLWPNLTEGLGSRIRIGTLAEIVRADPAFADGYPHHATSAQSFLVHEPSARALAGGTPAPSGEAAAADLIALWRKCPHLGCMVPALCDERKRFQCRCHGSTYNILGEKLERGPAERGMDRFAVEVDDDGFVVIDTREIIRGAPEGAVTFRDPHPPDAGCA